MRLPCVPMLFRVPNATRMRDLHSRIWMAKSWGKMHVCRFFLLRPGRMATGMCRGSHESWGSVFQCSKKPTPQLTFDYLSRGSMFTRYSYPWLM